MFPEIDDYKDRKEQNLVTVSKLEGHENVFESTDKRFNLITGEKDVPHKLNFTLEQLEIRKIALQKGLADIEQLIKDVEAL